MGQMIFGCLFTCFYSRKDIEITGSQSFWLNLNLWRHVDLCSILYSLWNQLAFCCLFLRHISHFMHKVPFPSPQRPRILVQVRFSWCKCLVEFILALSTCNKNNSFKLGWGESNKIKREQDAISFWSLGPYCLINCLSDD